MTPDGQYQMPAQPARPARNDMSQHRQKNQSRTLLAGPDDGPEREDEAGIASVGTGSAGAESGGSDASPGPIRTCVGCRGRDAQTHLLRIAVTDGRLLFDIQRRIPGRGAYVHRRRACVERATHKGRLGRALRIPPNPSHTSALRQLVSEAMDLEERARGSHLEYSSEPSQRPLRGPVDGNGVDIRRTDHEMNWLTRPQRQFVDVTRQAKGQ